MNVNQNLSILFYLKRKKASKDGTIPVYVRVTIDGLEDEMSVGLKVLSNDWDNETKAVKAGDRQQKLLNKKIGHVKTDLQRHFDLMQAKHEVAIFAIMLDASL